MSFEANRTYTAAVNHEEEDFQALLDKYEPVSKKGPRRGPKEGDTIEGIVVSISADTVFLEIGGKSEAILDAEQVRNDNGELTCKVGDSISARVVDTGEKSGTIILRKSLGRARASIDGLIEAHEHGLPVEGIVSGVNKGGVEVQIANNRGFCPISQLDMRFVDDPTSYVGSRYAFIIQRIEKGRGKEMNIVLSRRVLLEKEAAEKAKETISKLKEGLIIEGVVRSLKNYGAFIDIGGIQGLLPNRELGHGRINDPAEILEVDQRIKVQIIQVEETGDKKKPYKIALSLKSLMADPWDEIRNQLVVGSVYEGKVMRLDTFGAFVEVAPEIQGLVHISELGAKRHIKHPKEVVSVGSIVNVKILGIDHDKKRISLSMDVIDEKEAAEEIAANKEARKVATKIAGNSLGTLGDLLNKHVKKKR